MEKAFENKANQTKLLCQKFNIPTIPPETGEFLSLIIKISKAKKILEIGTGGGYSTLWLVKPIINQGEIITIEKDKFRYNAAKKNLADCKYFSRVKFLHGDAITVIKNIKKKFDLIFIDGKKSEYKKYFKNCAQKVKKGGLIICDDILYFQKHKKEVKRELKKNNILSIAKFLISKKSNKKMAEFIEFIKKSPHFETFILSIGNGLSVSLKAR